GRPVPGSTQGSTVEVYTQKNYVTVTGIHWGEPHLTIGDGQIGLDKLLDALGVAVGLRDKTGYAMDAETARETFERRLYVVTQATRGGRNDSTHRCAWFAAR